MDEAGGQKILVELNHFQTSKIVTNGQDSGIFANAILKILTSA